MTTAAVAIDRGEAHEASPKRCNIAPVSGEPPRAPGGVEVLQRLEGVCDHRGAGDLADRLAELRGFIEGDLVEVEAALSGIELEPTPMHQSARHLLALGGKRLRPTCVAVASRVGSGFSAAARELAVAAELVHDATLLHDDVVDVGELRRGAPAARVVYGNAASVFAGDWLLVEALERIQSAGVPGVLPRMLAVLKRMLVAEAWQLEARGNLRATRAEYFRVVEGKTASLFEWAMWAGGRAGGLAPDSCEALASYGRHLGVAFQVVDDVLDVAGDARVVGKSMFADLREGKLTYPLLLAIEHDRELGPRLEAASADGSLTLDDELERRAAAALAAAGAVEQTVALARSLSEQATASLAALPECRAVEALRSIAIAMTERRK